jgi:plastocyanin
MPKKKAVKRTKVTRPSKAKMDEHSFLIIVGGGFIILVIIGMFLLGKNHLQKLAAYQMLVSQEKMEMQKEQTVSIKDFAFNPQTVTVKVGAVVTWQNNDTVSHDVVADDGTFDTKMLAPGEKGSYTFTKAGTYTYKCGIHPSMTGTIVVEE